MSLNVLLTRSQAKHSQQENSLLMERLRERGFSVRHIPVFLLNPIQGPLSASSPVKLTGQEDLIFITRLSVEVFKRAGILLPSTSRCFAIGEGTAETFRDHFPNHPIVTPREAESENSEGLLQLPQFSGHSSRRVFIFRGDSGREFLADCLREQGRLVEYVTCYERKVNPDFRRFWVTPSANFCPDWVILTSTESLRVFLETPKLAEWPLPYITVLPGRMEQLAMDYGYPKILPLEKASNEGILKATDV
jgi:uroporphyrinogen-III synthase